MTGRVAPHEACEVRLVAAGTKPLASIEKRKNPILYSIAASCAAAGMIVAVFHKTVDSPEGEVVITSPRNRRLIPEYLKLLSTGVSTYGIKEYHRRMGRLYGYREEDIQAFIDSEVHCDCSKCKGNGGIPPINNAQQD